MEDTKNKTSLTVKILLILFSAFLIMYVSKEAGYYEYRTYTKKELTLKDYVEDEYIDYSNIVTDTGSKIGNTIETFMNEGIKKTLEFLGALFYK